jgi:hypothetical protein
MPFSSKFVRWPQLAALLLLPLAACEAGMSQGSSLDMSGRAVRGNTYGASDVGTKALQRLSQVEYNNSVRDLVGTALTPASDFPTDETSNNFDNIVDVLSISPSLMQQYVAAAVALGDEVAASATDASKKNGQYLRVAPCAADAKAGEACLKQAAGSFALRAWRRPPSAQEVDQLVGIAQSAGGDLPSQVGALVSAALTSPYFLFRVEFDNANEPSQAHALNGYELATRLSYFVWRSTPDDALLASAKAGTLVDDEELTSQLSRMLADDKAQSLVQNFAERWLLINKLAEVQPDAATFPAFNAQVRASMLAETDMFVKDFVLGDQPLDKMLTADYTYVDDTMAAYYGMPAPGSKTPVKTSLPSGSNRVGLLTQGTILTVGSTSATTSPIRRGKLIIAQLLCAAPPPPPANIPALPSESGTNMTLRQALAQHTANPSCSACHVNMDDLGFAFEGFDGAGKSRTSDNNSPIDATGKYFQTQSFNGPNELVPLLANDPRLSTCPSQLLFGYAMGRTTTSGDKTVLAGLAQDFSAQKLSLKGLMRSIVLSAPFRSRHG